MRYKTLLLFIFICCEISSEALQGPPEKNTKNDEEETSKNTEFVGSFEDRDGATAIHIESAPDLSNERDKTKDKISERDISDAVDLFMLDQAKVIEKMVQHFDMMNALQESTAFEVEDMPDLPKGALQEKEYTPEELEANKIYDTALAMLNKTRPDKMKAYQLLIEASNKRNLDATAMVAWAKLFGNPLKQDIHFAKQMFQELADVGNPEGHMGLGELVFGRHTVYYPHKQLNCLLEGLI
ncbi:unnamed protein product [Acanthoscelides obtectus]|uniref:Uncharacterized protein n=1 Tax=Acanthoscelides obtectus TaxID=200917 RepID=A0A9P0LX48_ACAOB|nr:unnamed protein product [Acanthoscelides obtectus]CAK1681732.1 Protein sel-1 homolog 1 [Acanthoscelides obtectus]